MGLIEKADVVKLLQDEDLMEEVVAKIVEDPACLDQLAEDIADEMSDALEDNPQFKQTILKAALGDPTFKKRLTKQLAKEVGD